MNKYSVLVVGCKKHEEIADRFFKLAFLHWPEILGNIVFCTDTISSFQESFPATIIDENSSGSYKERIKKGLSGIKTEYVLLLLDDYFLTEKIDNALFEELILSLKKNNLVYCKLIGLPRCYKRFPAIKGTYLIKKKTHYGISLQPSIWKTENLLEALGQCDGKNAWEVESAFSNYQRNNYDKCLTFNKNYLKFKNGVLRGQLFPYTNKILLKNNIEPLNLDKISFSKYLLFSTKQHLAMHLPIWLRKVGKKIGKRLGNEYYSED